MAELETKGYSRAVTQLLTHGTVEQLPPEDWFDYVGHYGLSEEDVPGLITLATGIDVGTASPQQDAPVHAIRALGQLGDPSADLYLVRMLSGSVSRAREDNSILYALSMFGLPGLKALEWFFDWVADEDEEGELQSLAIEGISLFAQRQLDHGTRCVDFLMAVLANSGQHTLFINAIVVYHLIELKVTGAAALIQRAFEQNRIDEDVVGRWPDVQIQLGLAEVTDFEPGELLYEGELYPSRPLLNE